MAADVGSGRGLRAGVCDPSESVARVDTSLAPYDEAVALFMRWLSRFGLAQAREIIFNEDGSDHIESRVPRIIEER